MIGVTIMAHPSRQKQAQNLYDDLLVYPFDYVKIVWDESNDEWDTGRRALFSGVEEHSDYHMVLQDDAILTPSFYQNVAAALDRLDEPTLVSLYTGKVRPEEERVNKAVQKAIQTGASWLTSSITLYWGVGIVIPTKDIEPLLADKYIQESIALYDVRIGSWYSKHRKMIHYTMPSLVDHDDSLPSILDHKVGDGKRVAHNLAQGEVKWNTRKVDIIYG